MNGMQELVKNVIMKRILDYGVSLAVYTCEDVVGRFSEIDSCCTAWTAYDLVWDRDTVRREFGGRREHRQSGEGDGEIRGQHKG